jgi:predicted nucleic-acid-binding Zn-ribbon protein
MKNIKLTIDNHRNCPKCGSSNTDVVVDHGRCLCGGNCWRHPECLDCGYEGYMNSRGIYWDADKTENGKIVFND